jgi:hypothetical protein
MANGIIRLDEGWRLDEGHHLDEPPHVPAAMPPPKKRRRNSSKSNRITHMADYVPSKREERRSWLQNIKTKAPAQVVAGGGTAAQATNLTTAADTLLAAYDATDSAQTALEGKKAIETSTEAEQIGIIRGIFTTLKVLPNWKSSGADAELQSSATSTAFDPGTYKPVLSVEIKGGLITITFKKKGVDALAIYARLRGTQGWTKIGIDTSSPYIDGRPLATPGVAETREYMARGMIGDDEIGLESDIISIAYGG